MKFLTLIDSLYPNFSKQEKKIAEYIKIKEQDIAFMSLQDISRDIQVSEATIMRFTRKLGYRGFVDFKLEIAREESVSAQSIESDFVENIAQNIEKTVNQTKNLLNHANLEAAIKLVEKARNIFVFGTGASGIAAMELQARFMRYGKIINCEQNNHFQIMQSSILGSEDLIIAISLTGETPDLIYPVEVASARGCRILGITNNSLSTLAQLADVCLLTAGRENPLNGGSLISKISQLYVIDLLATGYALHNKEEAERSKEHIAWAIAHQK